MNGVTNGPVGRKVIFIGGTSYSGSTMLDMIIGNDPAGFSCGEIGALFHPYRAHHLTPQCGCGEPACDIWHRIRRAGAGGAYEAIFELFPSVRFIVDSTKNPLWIRERERELRACGVDVRHVLIWKTPDEFRRSHQKRGRHGRIERAWLNYHHAYFSLVSDWRAVAYADLMDSQRLLEHLCDYLGIPWFDGKQCYWDKRHHIVFGNDSAKIHLYDAASEAFRACDERLREMVMGEQEVLAAYRVLRKQAAAEEGEVQGWYEERDTRLVDVVATLRRRDILARAPVETARSAAPGDGQRYWAAMLSMKRMLRTVLLRLRQTTQGRSAG